MENSESKNNSTDHFSVNSLDTLISNFDHAFLIMMGIIIIFMQAGFGFLEAGSIRAKNTTNILIKNYADLCMGGIAFWLTGYSFAFGEHNPFIGLDHFALINTPRSDHSFFFFQCTFAATCATIVSGAIAERCSFNGYIIFAGIMTGIIYPIPTHWCWANNGWLNTIGFSDFAGSGVVHLAGGTCALVGAIILGPRLDRFNDESDTYVPGHNIPHVALGGFLLVAGFMAFNGGSQASITAPGDGQAVGTAVVSTLLACGTGGLVVLFMWKLTMPFSKSGNVWSLCKFINGCLAAMVSSSAGCNDFYPWISCLVSCISGLIYIFVSDFMVQMQIDDPLDAVAVHGGPGLWGLIAAGLFKADGLLRSGNVNMLIWNVIGGACIIVWHAICSAILFITLKKLGLLRIPKKLEESGLDEIYHREPAYRFDSGKGSVSPSPLRVIPAKVVEVHCTHEIVTPAKVVEVLSRRGSFNSNYYGVTPAKKGY